MLHRSVQNSQKVVIKSAPYVVIPTNRPKKSSADSEGYLSIKALSSNEVPTEIIVVLAPLTALLGV